MKSSSRWLRRVEMILWITGLSLLGVALGATLNRWHYQRQESRALFQSASAGARATVHLTHPTLVESLAADRSQGATIEIQPHARQEQREPVADSEPAEDRASSTSEKVAPRATHNPRDEMHTVFALDPDAIGRLEIPRLGVAAIVRAGADEDTLARAVGLIPGTAKPGENGNVVLAGHRDTFFRPLRKIELNDRIRLVVPPNTYEYRVASTRIVTPDETSVLDSHGIDELTLVTCYPFHYIGSAPDRFIVTATRVN